MSDKCTGSCPTCNEPQYACKCKPILTATRYQWQESKVCQCSGIPNINVDGVCFKCGKNATCRLCTNCDQWHKGKDIMCDDCMKPRPDHIADDGKKVEVQTATKHDSGKTRYSLLPWEQVLSALEVARAREEFELDADYRSLDVVILSESPNWHVVAGCALILLQEMTCDKEWRTPWAALRAVSEVFTSGAETYGDYNWQRGLSETRRLDACRRHWAAYCCGEEISDHGHHHLAHVLWYGLVGMWYDAQGKEGK